jgi:hypothetical protein
MKADQSRCNETQEEKINRLFKQDTDKLKERKQQLDNFYYAQYDFQPKINNISKTVGRQSSLNELANKRGKKKT